MDETQRATNDRRARARKQGIQAFAGALTLSLMVALGLKAVESIGLRPLRYIESKDAQIVQLLSPRIHNKPLREKPVFRPVVFVDFDDRTMKSLAQAQGSAASDPAAWVPGRSTPRAPIADVLAQVTRSQPAVVLLNFDLRDRQLGSADELLRQAIERRDADKDVRSVPVLIPRSLHPFDSAHCGEDPSGPGPSLRGLDTLVDGTKGPGVAHFVHDHFESDSLGYVAGICKAFSATSASRGEPLALPAASELAVQLARKDSDAGRGRSWRVQFRVNGEPVYEAPFESGKTRMIYQRIPAHSFLGSNHPDLVVLKDAIVIIGATHMGVGDMHRTAMGLMPGAVVHANAVLQAQIGDVEEVSHGAHRWVEILVAVALAATYACLYEYRSVMGATGPRWRDRWVRARNFIQTAVLSALAIVAWSLLVMSDWVFADVSHFPVVAPVIVVFAELMFEALKGVQEMVEHAVRQWTSAEARSEEPHAVDSGSRT